MSQVGIRKMINVKYVKANKYGTRSVKIISGRNPHDIGGWKVVKAGVIQGAGITEPGAYVERETGNLVRVPQFVYESGCIPSVTIDVKDSPQQSGVAITPRPEQARFLRISKDPLITLAEARNLSLGAQVEPSF